MQGHCQESELNKKLRKSKWRKNSWLFLYCGTEITLSPQIHLPIKKHSHCYPCLRPKSHLSPTVINVNTGRARDQPSSSPWAGSQSTAGVYLCSTEPNIFLYSVPYITSSTSKQIKPQGASLQPQHVSSNLILHPIPFYTSEVQVMP